jgi:hypothetical protein
MLITCIRHRFLTFIAFFLFSFGDVEVNTGIFGEDKGDWIDCETLRIFVYFLCGSQALVVISCAVTLCWCRYVHGLYFKKCMHLESLTIFV